MVIFPYTKQLETQESCKPAGAPQHTQTCNGGPVDQRGQCEIGWVSDRYRNMCAFWHSNSYSSTGKGGAMSAHAQNSGCRGCACADRSSRMCRTEVAHAQKGGLEVCACVDLQKMPKIAFRRFSLRRGHRTDPVVLARPSASLPPLLQDYLEWTFL
ncbi:hypothetical protein FKM82_012391 [Ascaphus truei]